MSATVVARKPAVGDAFWVLGGLYEVKAASDETNGDVVAMEMTMRTGMGPPLHTHTGAEVVYVLEGRVRYIIGEETTDAEAGSFFYVPAGTWERFEPLTDARVLVVYTPGGEMDKFFAEVGEPAAAHELPPMPTSPPDIDRLIAAGARHGMHMRPPAGM